MPETRSHQSFRQRIEYLHTHLSVMDASVKTALSAIHSNSEASTINDALAVEKHYTRLNHPTTESYRIFNYSKSTLHKNALVELHSIFSNYLKCSLREVLDTRPYAVLMLSDNEFSIKYRDIFNFSTLEKLYDHILDVFFKGLESQRSTKKMLQRIISKFNINAHQELSEALPFFELRHLIVHNKGEIDSTFARNYGEFFSVQEGDKVPSNYQNTHKAIVSIQALTKAVDEGLQNYMK